jgi:hypothetical protein
MPGDESTLLVPLRSNANTLLAGAPVAAFRRRLKYASIFYDRLLLEGGVLRLNAGPTLSFSAVEPFNEQDPPRWQTAAARHAAEQAPFQLAVGREDTPGVPASTMHVAGSSETTISWVATLYPFADELPASANWVEFVRSREPEGRVKDLADQWTRADEHNLALQQAIPVRFVRDTVVKNVNRDLSLATASGFDITVDPFHQRVVDQRFSDEAGWNVRGYAVPILFPKVSDKPWEVVAEVHRDRNMASFRAVLREVEAEALAEAAGGDIEAAAHHAYERHLERATHVEGIRVPIEHTAGGLLISAATGAAALPLAGLGGLIASTLGGTVIGGILDARSYIRQRRSKGWVTVATRLRADD